MWWSADSRVALLETRHEALLTERGCVRKTSRSIWQVREACGLATLLRLGCDTGGLPLSSVQGHQVLTGDAGIDVRERFLGAREIGVGEIHFEQAEFFRVTELPFEVVHQRPVEKAAHVHA